MLRGSLWPAVLWAHGGGVSARSAAEACRAEAEDASLLQLRDAGRSKLCRGLSGGALDGLAAGGAPYTAEEVSRVACNMAANIFPNGTIIASPSKGTEPVYTLPNGSAYLQNDYYYMWQRDAGLTMRTLLRVAGDVPVAQEQLKAYAAMMVRKIYSEQESPNHNCAPWNDAMGGYCSMYGEPKFFVNQSVFDQSWGRLQNDGPAINALVLMKVLELPDVPPGLLNATKSTVVRVLNWLGQVVSDSTIDPWEMLYGQHFFVQALQHRAMTDAAARAAKGELTGDVASFGLWAREIKSLLEVHWVAEARALTETVARTASGTVGPKCVSTGRDSAEAYPVPEYRPCELDVATLLGSLSAQSDVVPPYDSRVLATAELLIQSMGPTYEVNRLDDEAGLPGVLVGRYPGDEYSGVIMSAGLEDPCVGFNCGNPWFLRTHALAEVLYEAAAAAAAGRLQADALNSGFLMQAVNLAKPASQRFEAVALPQGPGSCADLGQLLLDAGDGVLLRAKHHLTKRGLHMSEQIYRGDDKYPGVQPGAQFGVRDLTWSYASLLDALAARSAAHRAIHSRGKVVDSHT